MYDVVKMSGLFIWVTLDGQKLISDQYEKFSD